MSSEKQFENKVKRYLESVGVYAMGTSRHEMKVDPVGYYEKRHGNVFTGSGRPDLHICIHGKSIEVELKKETGTPKPLQLYILEQINAAGGNGILLYPKDFDMFVNLIGTYL